MLLAGSEGLCQVEHGRGPDADLLEPGREGVAALGHLCQDALLYEVAKLLGALLKDGIREQLTRSGPLLWVLGQALFDYVTEGACALGRCVLFLEDALFELGIVDYAIDGPVEVEKLLVEEAAECPDVHL